MAIKKILRVPYYIQPNDNTCQATCLKMIADYLDDMRGVCAYRDINDIYRVINHTPARPNKSLNHFDNFKWWLQQEFPDHPFMWDATTNEKTATWRITNSIDQGFPVITSTSHRLTKGHIILVIGYLVPTSTVWKVPQGDNYPGDFLFYCHDPYGDATGQWGDQRYDPPNGPILWGLGDVGPGAAVLYDINGLRRYRYDDKSRLSFFLLRVQLLGKY